MAAEYAMPCTQQILQLAPQAWPLVVATTSIILRPDRDTIGDMVINGYNRHGSIAKMMVVETRPQHI